MIFFFYYAESHDGAMSFLGRGKIGEPAELQGSWSACVRHLIKKSPGARCVHIKPDLKLHPWLVGFTLSLYYIILKYKCIYSTKPIPLLWIEYTAIFYFFLNMPFKMDWLFISYQKTAWSEHHIVMGVTVNEICSTFRFQSSKVICSHNFVNQWKIFANNKFNFKSNCSFCTASLYVKKCIVLNNINLDRT